MKINGQTVTPPEPCTLVIPRQTGNIVFEARTILDFGDFAKLCPEPKAPMAMRPGGQQFMDVNSPEYIKAINEWALNKVHWVRYTSLLASPGLEFETVDPSNPKTWSNYEIELRDSGFTQLEINRIIQLADEANGFNQDKIDEATERFLVSRREMQNK